MNIENISRMDLNLLVCLKVLFDEQNVTRAAERLFITQSAMSKSLAKLRTHFDDPLFVRTSHGLRPTPRAKMLRPKLEQLLEQLQELNRPQTFDPYTSDKRFNIALVESGYPLILPHFLPSLFKQAPNLNISTHIWNDYTFNQLLSGELDIGITGKDIEAGDAKLSMVTPQGIVEHEIYRDNQVCVLRNDHPALNKEWNIENYLKLRHVQVRCDGHDKWLLDHKLADINLYRDIAITVPDFNSAASLCTYTDFVFTAPSHFSNLMANHFNLVVVPLPVEIPPMAYTLFWSEDREQDPAISWLVKMIEERTAHLR